MNKNIQILRSFQHIFPFHRQYSFETEFGEFITKLNQCNFSTKVTLCNMTN